MAPKKHAEPAPASAKVEEKSKQGKDVHEEPPPQLIDGDFVFQDGSTYSGQYCALPGEDIKFHGTGILQTGPETFEGTFEHGHYKFGKYKTCSGALYVGDFRNNLFHGVGEYLWPDGRLYRGTWREGRMHGRGLYYNFSVGADKAFSGFSLWGKFSSEAGDQAEAKRVFMAEYGGECTHSADACLHALAQHDGAPAEFLVPPPPESGEHESPEAAAARAAVEEIVTGPFPPASSTSQALMQAFVAKLGSSEGSEKLLKVNVLADANEASSFDGKRLKRQQLQVVGQCIEFLSVNPEPGSLSALVLVNVSLDPDIAKAKWKVVHCQVVPT